MRSVCKENILHGKQFWNQVKKSYPVLQNEVPTVLCMINGNLANDNEEIAHGFFRFFAEINNIIKASVFSTSAVSQFEVS